MAADRAGPPASVLPGRGAQACDHRLVRARREPDGGVSLRMSYAEAVVLHEVVAFSEWSNGLTEIELREPVERKVVSDVQQSLAPLIPELGTGEYGPSVRHAQSQVDPTPF
ncbi:hypothetical protein GALL_387220 [mine drainage metagenome]|uniref:Uncharacterized protein n=1 Tax=mine drainage metagenome TaxID=410659 RepID=A0A1J5QHQ7_9ZZZZ